MQTGSLFSAWVGDCPLTYSSNNAPKVKDVLGTILISVLSGYSRYCHSSALYGDEVASSLLGLSKIVSHDSLSRGLKKMDAEKAEQWLHSHLLRKTEPLLQNVIGCLAKSGGKRRLHLSMNGKYARETGLIFEKISTFLTAVSTAAQLKPEENGPVY
jgi:hypothetical protein